MLRLKRYKNGAGPGHQALETLWYPPFWEQIRIRIRRIEKHSPYGPLLRNAWLLKTVMLSIKYTRKSALVVLCLGSKHFIRIDSNGATKICQYNTVISHLIGTVLIRKMFREYTGPKCVIESECSRNKQVKNWKYRHIYCVLLTSSKRTLVMKLKVSNAKQHAIFVVFKPSVLTILWVTFESFWETW